MSNAKAVLLENRVLSDKDCAKLIHLEEILKLKKQNPNKFFECPFCPGGAVVKNPSENKIMTCLFCTKESCLNCKEEAHNGTCLEAKFGRINNIDTFFSLAMDEFFIRRCANCNQVFIKTKACNAVSCETCKHYTCYVCGKGLGSMRNSAYRHFGGSRGLCSLFSESTDIKRNKLFYNEAKERAIGLTREWFDYRTKNNLTVDGVSFKIDDLGKFIDDQMRRLDEENKFDD
jgi:hypothetical protein